jgi:hypothetical protein
VSPKPSTVCQLCAYDDYLEYASLPDDVWVVTCSNPAHERWTWSPTPELPTGPIAEGLAAELGLFDKLLPTLREGGFDEYGIIEYRFGIECPADYATLLATYNHRARQRGLKYSMSSFLAGVLTSLRFYGEVGHTQGPGSGYWRYLSEVSYWSRSTDTDPKNRRTWAEYAESIDLDPDVWPLVPDAIDGGR